MRRRAEEADATNVSAATQRVRAESAAPRWLASSVLGRAV